MQVKLQPIFVFKVCIFRCRGTRVVSTVIIQLRDPQNRVRCNDLQDILHKTSYSLFCLQISLPW